MKKLTALLLAVFLVTAVFTACKQTEPVQPVLEELPSPVEIPAAETPPPSPKKPSTVSATLLAAGDNLIHNSIYLQAEKRAAPGSYDFLPVYEGVSEEIAQADLAFLNQETILASDAFPLSSYPTFCSPTQLGDQLISLGFDVFTHANNHVFDKGEEGALAALDYWAKQTNAVQTGLFANRTDEETIRVVTRQGIRFGFLAFTMSTNGLSLRKDSPVHVLAGDDRAAVAAQVALAKKVSDVVVVSVHWGIENDPSPSEKQTELAEFYASLGVDIVLGSHPHVLQPIAELARPDGGKTLVIYSLGNFVSHQMAAANMIGGFLKVKVTLEEESRKIALEASFLPTITQFEQGGANIRILPFSAYTPALAAAHGVNKKEPFTMEFIEHTLNTVITPAYWTGG